jgi:hypothetical protein
MQWNGSGKHSVDGQINHNLTWKDIALQLRILLWLREYKIKVLTYLLD